MGFLDVSKEGPLAVVKVNRPDALNALNGEVLGEIRETMEALDADSAVRVVIITGEGKAFVAGADIAEMVDMGGGEAEKLSLHGQRAFLQIEMMGTVVIAAINGFALGGGLELALACDLRYASEKAKLGQPEVTLGVTPGFAGTQRLPRIVGLPRAKEMLLTGDLIDAKRAEEIGLVNGIFGAEELMEKVTEIALKIASRGPLSVKLVKKAINEGLVLGSQEGGAIEAKYFGECFASGETGEGMRAFLEKREPTWKE